MELVQVWFKLEEDILVAWVSPPTGKVRKESPCTRSALTRGTPKVLITMLSTPNVIPYKPSALSHSPRSGTSRTCLTDLLPGNGATSWMLHERTRPTAKLMRRLAPDAVFRERTLFLALNLVSATILAGLTQLGEMTKGSSTLGS